MIRGPAIGDSGCLVGDQVDADGVALLVAFGVEAALTWARDGNHPHEVSLTPPPLGIGVRAPTPELLGEGVAYLAAAVDSLLPHVGGRDPQSTALALIPLLRRHFAVRPASAPLHVTFTIADAGVVAPTPLPPEEEPMTATRAPGVEDHRPFASATEKSLRRRG